MNNETVDSEAVTGRFSARMVFLESLQNHRKTTSSEFLSDNVAGTATLLKRDTGTGVVL